MKIEIKVKIGEQEIAYEDARRIYNELHKLFGKDEKYDYFEQFRDFKPRITPPPSPCRFSEVTTIYLQIRNRIDPFCFNH